jgi:hypothetical protein
MGHFAKVENGIVTNVIVADQSFIDASGIEGTWLETTIGAVGGIIYEISKENPTLPIPTNLPCVRKNYAGIGYTYNETLDAFIPPKLYNSWILDETTCQWKAPVNIPTDGKMYSWNEETLTWLSTTKI